MPAIAALTPQPIAQAPQPAVEDDSGFGFADFLDLINPLQHIPIVSTLYRHLTGDKIGTVERIAGDTLYGGLMGFAASLGDTLFEEITGKTVGDTVYAFLTSDDKGTGATAVASAPVAVKSASNITVALPDLSFLSGTADNGQPAATLQYAASAYGKAAQRSMEAY
jgi:hypothetical protein